MKELMKLEPVRLYAIAAAVLALVAYYVTVPAPLILSLVAALLGIGVKPVRSAVMPTAKIPSRVVEILE